MTQPAMANRMPRIESSLGFLKTPTTAKIRPIMQMMAPTTLINGTRVNKKPIKATTKAATPRPFLLVFSAIIFYPKSVSGATSSE